MIDLEVGSSPDWELKSHNEEELKSVKESGVILHSLRQSRYNWLHGGFPKFSSRSRSKTPNEPKPPPHTIQSQGRCTLQIGPLSFYETTIYEVHYMSPFDPNTTYSAPTSPTKGPSTSEVLPVITITPALIGKINRAASKDPQLSKLLQSAALGNDTPEQTKRLGSICQSVALSDDPDLESAEFEIVLEFKEAPSERWTLPRGPYVLKSRRDALGYFEIELITLYPFSGTRADLKGSKRDVLSMVIKRANENILHTVSKWIGDEEKQRMNQEAIDKARNEFTPVYPAHRLTEESPLFQKIQAQVLTPYHAMKPLRSTVISATPTTTVPKRNAVTMESSVDMRESGPGSGREQTESASLKKRRRVSLAETHACSTCGKADIPLYKGGLFCRSCVDSSKRAKADQKRPGRPAPAVAGILKLAPDSMS